jgi:hypothetical protein
VCGGGGVVKELILRLSKSSQAGAGTELGNRMDSNSNCNILNILVVVLLPYSLLRAVLDVYNPF